MSVQDLERGRLECEKESIIGILSNPLIYNLEKCNAKVSAEVSY
jgi:hypothetical protein